MLIYIFVYVLFVKILISTDPFKTKYKFLVFVSEIPLSKTHFLKEKIPTFENEPYHAKLSLSHKVFAKVFLTNENFHLKNVFMLLLD